MNEQTVCQTSIFGRLANELTRVPLTMNSFNSKIGSTYGQRKIDGYFVFNDLIPTASPYEVTTEALRLQSRKFTANYPTPTAVEIFLPGEDELYVRLTGVVPATNTVSFDPIPFVQTIYKDSSVFGEGGFTATLAEPVEGDNVNFAILSDVTGLAVGELLRLRRSNSLMLRPDPYYQFPGGITQCAVKVMNGALPATPLSEVILRITEVDSNAPGTTDVGGLDLHTVTVGAIVNILGTVNDIQTKTNARGDAVLYFRSGINVSALQVEFSKTGFVTASQAFIVNTGERNAFTVTLNPV